MNCCSVNTSAAVSGEVLDYYAVQPADVNSYKMLNPGKYQ